MVPEIPHKDAFEDLLIEVAREIEVAVLHEHPGLCHQPSEMNFPLQVARSNLIAESAIARARLRKSSEVVALSFRTTEVVFLVFI